MSALILIAIFLAIAAAALGSLALVCAWVSGEVREARMKKKLGAAYEGPAED